MPRKKAAAKAVRNAPTAKSENNQKKDLIEKFRVKRSVEKFEAFEDKNTIHIRERIKYYNTYFNELKYQIIFQNEMSFIENIVKFVIDNGLEKYQKIINVLREFKGKINIITYQLDFVKNFYDKHLNKSTTVDIKTIKKEYIEYFKRAVVNINELDSEKTRLISAFKTFADNSLNDLYYRIKEDFKMPFELLQENKNKPLTDSTLNKQLTSNRGYILHKNSIHNNYSNDNVKGNFPYKDINKFSVLSLKYDTKNNFSFYIEVFSVSSILTYYVIQKYNHHFLLTYFYIYNTTSKSSSDSYIDIISEKYKEGIQGVLTKLNDEKQKKNIIVQCVLSIFSFHQYAKYYHNNTGNIDQAFVYNETIKPLNKKRYVKYILDDVVFFLEDMGYIVYIWGFNQGNKQIEKFENPNKQKILDDYLNFFNVQSLPQLFDKTKLSLDNQELTIITDPIMFEVKLVKIILGLLEYPIDDTNIPLEDAEIINKNYPCYLTMPSNVEFCFGVKTKSDSIVSVDTTKIEYKDNDILKFNSIEYTTLDNPNSKIKKYTNDNNTIYIIQHMDIPTLHIAYIISDKNIDEVKAIGFEDSEIKRIFNMYLSNLYDITKLLTG